MKKFIYILIFAFCFAFAVSSCNEDKVKDITKDGSIETVINVDHLDATHDVIRTTYSVWVKSVLVKKYVHSDTIPALGNTVESGENNEGDTKSIELKKDYEVYITVK